MTAFVNDVKFIASTSGTVDFGIGGALAGFQTPAAAGAIDGEQYAYTARAISGSQFESGECFYNAGANTLSRATIYDGSAGAGIKVNFTASPVVILTLLADDLPENFESSHEFYVRTDGNDSNGGHVDSAAGAWRTLQHAYDDVSKKQLNGFTGRINIGTGTYDSVVMTRSNKTGTISFSGGVNNVFVTATNGISFDVHASLNIAIDHVTCIGNNTGTGVYGLGDGVIVALYAVSFTNLHYPIFADRGSDFEISGDITVSGNAIDVFSLFYSLIVLNDSLLTMSGTPTWNHAFINANDQAMFHIYRDVTFSGNAIGPRFYVADGATIQTLTNDVNFFPGNAAGTIDAGGQYDNISANSNGAYTVATLPPAANVPDGQRAFVSDSDVTLAAGIGQIVVHTSGTNRVPVYKDGSDWRIG